MEMSKIIIGAMRFRDRTSAVATIRFAIDAGFNYIDTSPAYCYKSEDENSESWVGEAINFENYRERVMISAKCSPGDGGRGLGPFDKTKGFGVRTQEQLQSVFRQSMERQALQKLECYQMWSTHTTEQFQAAFEQGGWYDGVMNLKDKWDSVGLTTHADTDKVIEFLETGKFSMVTIPLNIINRTRLGVVDYCKAHGIKVIAMNPFGGGFLATNKRLKDLAFRYLMALDNVHLLIGFSSPDEVLYAKRMQEQVLKGNASPERIIQEADSLLGSTEPRCTSCGYCMPCPEDINLGAALSYYNIYKYLKLDAARKSFQNKQWEDGLRLDHCKMCGICTSRCPNGLDLGKIIADAKEVLYKKS